MKGDQKVIELLNEILGHELTAIDQYFVHSQMYDDWGYSKLFERISHEMVDEQGHAKELIERILFLGGKPSLEKRATARIGSEVPEMLSNDLELELTVISQLRSAITYCESVGDFTSSNILKKNLKDSEEDHALWLEQQLGHIEKLGLPNYLMSSL